MAGIVFGAIAPHGHLAIPEACPPRERNLATATQAAMVELGQRCAASRPDVVVILTPHNIHVERHIAVVIAGSLAGNLDQWTDSSIALTGATDRDLARAILRALDTANVPALGVYYGANDQVAAAAPMDWGVLIPYWFMGGKADPPLPLVAISPARDLSRDEHVRLGQVLASTAAASGKRVALVASADHGHAHLASGPYGYDPAAAIYDARVTNLVRENRLAELLEIDQALIDAAKADSYLQMLVLHAALGPSWRGEFLAYEAPTYFGMLCAAYAPA